jgi:LmbE family N-acetylglucosaminyl deacetylase
MSGLTLMAHPDDKSLGLGDVLARYVGEGAATSLVTATRDQSGH